MNSPLSDQIKILQNKIIQTAEDADGLRQAQRANCVQIESSNKQYIAIIRLLFEAYSTYNDVLDAMEGTNPGHAMYLEMVESKDLLKSHIITHERNISQIERAIVRTWKEMLSNEKRLVNLITQISQDINNLKIKYRQN